MRPDHEPRVTENIDHIITMIEKILNNKNATLMKNMFYLMLILIKIMVSYQIGKRMRCCLEHVLRLQIIRNILVILFYGSLQVTMNQDGIVLGDMEDWLAYECSSMVEKYLGEEIDIH